MLPHGSDQIAAVLALSDERDTWIKRILAAERAEYARGKRDGVALGELLALEDRAERWRAMACPVSRGGATWAEVEERRWVVRGERGTRETFADPHPSDYPGRDA